MFLGYDLHKLVDKHEGKPLVVGGVDIPITESSGRTIKAHSDGDVVYHAVTDALLSAAGSSDIGQLFPDTDPKWKNAKSDLFLKEAVKILTSAGYKLNNVDITVVTETPKIKSIKEAVIKNLSHILGEHVHITLKGKTHEGVDAVGEKRAISSYAVALSSKIPQ